MPPQNRAVMDFAAVFYVIFIFGCYLRILSLSPLGQLVKGDYLIRVVNGMKIHLVVF